MWVGDTISEILFRLHCLLLLEMHSSTSCTSFRDPYLMVLLRKKKEKKKNTKPQPAWPHGLLQHPCISTRWWLKRVLQKKHLVWLGGSKPLIWFHLNHHFLTGEGERLFVQSEDEPGESSRDRWMLDITNYIPVMRFQGAKRNHLNGSKQEGATWFWQRFLQGSDSQRCKATSSGNER